GTGTIDQRGRWIYYSRPPKAEWEPEVEAISSSTREKLRQILFRLMREAGILNQEDHICRALLSPSFMALMAQSDPHELRYFPGAELGR
uniref:BrxA family protein n=1 Tax=Erythrobacter donghaensis TaxID=267135 RepID=UPI000B1FF157